MDPENNTSTEGALPESTNVHEAAALLDALEERGDGNSGETSGTDAGRSESEAEGNAGQSEGVDGEAAVTEGAADGEGEAEAGVGEGENAALNEAPGFWSAEDKAAYASIPPALRPLIHKYEQQRIEYVKAKEQEAAKVRQEALAQAEKATTVVDEAAKWWQANGPQFFKNFGDKWAQVNWDDLAENNPAEHTRLTHLRDKEAAMLRQAHERGLADIKAANERAQAQFQEAKRTEHEKVVKELPEHFGTPDKAVKTYETLGKYLFDAGIPAERINQIHEAPIIKLAMKAMLYDQAKKQASAVVPNRDTSTGKFTAKTAPTRVQPGPAPQGSANRNAELARQVGERFLKSGGRDINDAAELIRLRGL